MKKEIKLEDVFNNEKKRGVRDLIDEHKQETLEEVAEQFEYTDGVYGFKQGVKWQQEQDQNVYLNGYVDGSREQAKLMYNEEEIILSMKNSYGFKYFSEKKFLQNLEQIKKK